MGSWLSRLFCEKCAAAIFVQHLLQNLFGRRLADVLAWLVWQFSGRCYNQKCMLRPVGKRKTMKNTLMFAKKPSGSSKSTSLSNQHFSQNQKPQVYHKAPGFARVTEVCWGRGGAGRQLAGFRVWGLCRGLCRGYVGFILGLYQQSGKENGNFQNGLGGSRHKYRSLGPKKLSLASPPYKILPDNLGASNILEYLFGVPMIKTIVFWGPYWGPLKKESFHLSFEPFFPRLLNCLRTQ